MKIYKVPLIVRGEIIEDYSVEYPGRKGGVSFVTPDINKYLKKLTTTPSGLKDLYSISIDDIVDFMVELGHRFTLTKNRYMQEAFEISTSTSGMTESVLRAVYSGFDTICEKSFLNAYVETQIGKKYLEGWVPVTIEDGRTFSTRAYGSRMVHVIAGNSPMCAFLTVLRNAVTRSDAIIKLPSNDPLTAISMIRTMIDIDPSHPVTRHASAAYWKGGDESIESRIYTPRNIEKIVAWGGFSSIKHITKYLQPGIDLITLDPKHSVSIIGKEGFKSDTSIVELAHKAAADSGSFNQELCCNSRVVYVNCDPENPEEMARVNQFGKALYEAMQTLPSSLSTPSKYVIPELQQQIDGLLLDDDYYRIFKEDDRRGAVIVSQTDEPVEFTAILACRTVNVVPIANIDDIINRINSDTQTIGIYPPSLKEDIRQALGFQGAQHLIDLGYMVYLDFLGPQDAVEVERRMLKWVKDIKINTDIAAKPWEGKKSHDALVSGQLF